MRILALGVFSASLLFGQLESNTVTVTASRSVYVQADQITFSISSPTDIAAGLQAAGISGAQLVAGGSGLPSTYTIAVPLNDTSATIAQLTAAQKKLNINFNVQGVQASPQALASKQCSNTDLIADARAQAQKLALAAGLTLGPITSLSDTGSGDAFIAGNYLAVARVGFFSLLGGITGIQSIPALTCSLTVKFGLVRF